MRGENANHVLFRVGLLVTARDAASAELADGVDVRERDVHHLVEERLLARWSGEPGVDGNDSVWEVGEPLYLIRSGPLRVHLFRGAKKDGPEAVLVPDETKPHRRVGHAAPRRSARY